MYVESLLSFVKFHSASSVPPVPGHLLWPASTRSAHRSPIKYAFIWVWFVVRIGHVDMSATLNPCRPPTLKSGPTTLFSSPSAHIIQVLIEWKPWVKFSVTNALSCST